MFSRYDSLSTVKRSIEKLSLEDRSDYDVEIKDIEKLRHSYEHSQCSTYFYSMELKARQLADELAACKSDLEVERVKSKRLDASRIHSALIFASLSAAGFIVFYLPCPPFIAVAGIFGSFVLSFILFLAAFGIVESLYHHHPEMYEMDEKEDKAAFSAALAAPVILAAAYQLLKFFAQK